MEGGGSLRVENADEITSDVTEENVVRELGCDNQEIKIYKIKKKIWKKNLFFLLLHSPSTSFSFLLYVSSSSGGGDAGKS